MTSISYPPKNSVITFREPHFRREFSVNITKYYIRACITLGATEVGENGIALPEQQIRVVKQQQKDIMDYLLKVDQKLTNAVVRCDSYARFTVLAHSLQDDFFDLVKETKDV